MRAGVQGAGSTISAVPYVAVSVMMSPILMQVEAQRHHGVGANRVGGIHTALTGLERTLVSSGARLLPATHEA
jgi:hypothetical protein